MDEKLTRDRFNFASKKLKEMRENRILTDITLKCKGGSIFAHRCVLMATNQYFYDMLSNNPQGDTEIVLEFQDVSVQVLSTVISTLYGDVPREIKDDCSQIIKVLDASHLIQEKLLFKYCLQLLMDRLSVDNCANVWNVTAKYQEEKEEYQVMGFILDHLTEIITQNKLVDASIDQMCDFISYASRILDYGDQLLLVVISWGKKNQAERIEKVVTLINIVEKLNFSNYTSLRFELEYFSQNSLRLQQRLQPLMNRLLPKMAEKRVIIKPKPLGPTYSAPSPFKIPPPPSSASSHTTRTLIPVRILRKLAPATCSTISPLPSSITSCKHTLKSEFSSTETSVSLPTVAHFIGRNIQIHFFRLVSAPVIKMAVETYSVGNNMWRRVDEVPLPSFVSRCWYPLVSSKSKRFYFGITAAKTFVAFDESSGETYVGPSVSFRSQVSGVSDGVLMYLWNYEFIAQFNSELKEWKCISPNLHIVSNCSSLLAMNGGLYIHAVFPPILYKYDFEKESWVVKKVFPEMSALKAITCKCCRTDECKGQLYFYTNEKQLVIYDVIGDLCRSVCLSELESGSPLLMSCDQRFIVFSDKNKSDLFLFYPETSEIKYLEKCKSRVENRNILSCDLSVL